MDEATLKWCEAECRKECDRMADIGKKHPENSDARGRCFARSRSLLKMANLFKWQYAPDMGSMLRTGTNTPTKEAE